MASSAALAAEADGAYVGTRWYEPTAKKLCSSTGIKETISGGNVRLTLFYNGAVLSGELTATQFALLVPDAAIHMFDGRLASVRYVDVFAGSLPRDVVGTEGGPVTST